MMLKNFTVRARLIFLLAVSSFAILGMGIMTLVHVQKTQDHIDQLYFGGVTDIFQLFKVTKVHEDIIKTIYLVQNGTLNWTEGMREMQENREQIRSQWASYIDHPLYLKEEFIPIVKKDKEQMQQLIANEEVFLDHVQMLMQNQNQEQLNLLIPKMFFTFGPIRQLLNQLIEIHTKDTDTDYNDSINAIKISRYLTLILMISAFVVSLILSFLIVKSIVAPLLYAVNCMNRAAEGETEIKVENLSEGELGSLLQALSRMILSSKKMSKAFATMAAGDLSIEVLPRSKQDTLGLAMNKMLGQMRSMIGKIQSEVNTLTSSSQGITSSLSQLSAGAAETAAAVTETTTTIEELKQTSHLSADKAKEVLTSAEEILMTVKSSEKSVNSTINEMNQIQERMTSISDGIVKLSERSLAIAEIMDSVNDLAEQSNLLAVNAAIEAAKAGEQGRGFNVVAQEIRALAEQSKAATNHVKALLLEIQNATNAAVLATEQGSKAVLKGVDQSVQTNAAINELIKNINQFSQAASQIVLSSQQQFVGIEQVTIAMANINEATNQHVGQLSQIERSINLLKQAVLSLKRMTDQYKLSSRKTSNMPLISKRLGKALKNLST